VEYFLLPAIIGKYLFSLAVWVILFNFIIQSDGYYDFSDHVSEKWRKFKERRNAS